MNHRVHRYMRGHKMYSYVAPRYDPPIGPVFCRWDDLMHSRKNTPLIIGDHKFTNCNYSFRMNTVCRDVLGALILVLNLQLEHHTNIVNMTTDSLMIKIKNSTKDQSGVGSNSFGRVNLSFNQFAIDFLSMVLVFDAWLDHASGTAPSPCAQKTSKAISNAILHNREILLQYMSNNAINSCGTFPPF